MEAVGYTNVGSTDDTLDIDSVMLIKTLILDCNESVCQIFRYHIPGDRNTVGILGDQLRNLVSFEIINEGGEAGRCYLDVLNTGSGIDDSLENADSEAGTNNAAGQYRNQK